MGKAGMKQKLAELRIPPLLIFLCVVILMTVGVLSTMVVQEFLQNREYMKELNSITSPTSAPSASSIIIIDDNTGIINENITDSTKEPEEQIMETSVTTPEIANEARTFDGPNQREREHQKHEVRRYLR